MTLSTVHCEVIHRDVPSTMMRDRSTNTIRIGLGALFVVTLAVYGRILVYDAIPSWDDALYLFERPEVRHWWRATWRQRLLTPEIGYPLPVPTFVYAHLRMIDSELYPHFVHALSLGLHLLNMGLVFALVRRWHRGSMALVVTALWGLHPVGVEAVAWATNLKTVLAATCMLGSMLVWEAFLQSRDSPASPPWFVWTSVIGLFVLGLGCRPDVAVLPVLLALQTARQWGWNRPSRGTVCVVAGLVALGIGYVLLADRGHDELVQRATQAESGWMVRAIRIVRALELSARHLLVPLELHPGYFISGDPSLLSAIPGTLIVVLSTGLVYLLARREAWAVLFGLGLAFVWYLPFSNIVFLPRWTADTYLYLTGIGVVLALVVAMRRLIARGSEGTVSSRAARTSIGLVVVIASGLSVLTFQQTGRWQNGKTLWAPVIEYQPGVYRPYKIVAWEYAHNEQWEEAAEVLEEGLPLFRSSRAYPFFLPEVLEEVEQPRRATELATEAVLREASPRDEHYKVFLEVLARQERPLPENEELQQALERAVAIYSQHETWMTHRDLRLTIADYLSKQDEFDLTRPFILREFETDSPHCFAWRVVRRFPRPRREMLGAPSPPRRCLDASSDPSGEQP